MPLFFIEDDEGLAPAERRWTLIKADTAEEAADQARHKFWPELCGVSIRDDVPADVPAALDLMIGRRFSTETAKHLMSMCGMPDDADVLMDIPEFSIRNGRLGYFDSNGKPFDRDV